MAWIDGLDIPFQHYADSTFFEPGPEEVETRDAPSRSRSERLWGHLILTRELGCPSGATSMPRARSGRSGNTWSDRLADGAADECTR